MKLLLKTCLALALLASLSCVQSSANKVYYKLRERYIGMEVYRINGDIHLISDIEPAQVDTLAKKIRGFVDALRSGFGITSAMGQVTILAFKSQDGYNDYLDRYQKQHIHAQYGFYAPGERLVTVNYEAGDGTISHELAHAVVEADNKEVPVWFSEGLASLFEECEIIPNGQIRGKVNWRFYRVKNLSYAKENLVHWLATLEPDKFYNEDPERAYALARLFCFFLQEQGLLVPFYKALKERHHDTSGLQILRATFDRSIADIDAHFKQWAAGLLKD